MKIESNNLQRNLNDFQSAARDRDRTVAELDVRSFLPLLLHCIEFFI